MELPGHVSGLLKENGQMVNEDRYSPFGKPVLVQESVPNPLRYMAREWPPALDQGDIVRSGLSFAS